MYIGLREKRYGPDETRSRGGSHGASVPLPVTRKSRTHQSSSVMPGIRRTSAKGLNEPARIAGHARSSGATNATSPGRARKASSARISIAWMLPISGRFLCAQMRATARVWIAIATSRADSKAPFIHELMFVM